MLKIIDSVILQYNFLGLFYYSLLVYTCKTYKIVSYGPILSHLHMRESQYIGQMEIKQL
jgi:hypothetical protein